MKGAVGQEGRVRTRSGRVYVTPAHGFPGSPFPPPPPFVMQGTQHGLVLTSTPRPNPTLTAPPPPSAGAGGRQPARRSGRTHRDLGPGPQKAQGTHAIGVHGRVHVRAVPQSQRDAVGGLRHAGRRGRRWPQAGDTLPAPPPSPTVAAAPRSGKKGGQVAHPCT